MNKNRKRLSKLLIPMLALSGANIDAMENAKPKTTIKTNLRYSKSKGKTIKGNRYRIQGGDSALDKLLNKYKPLETYNNDPMNPIKLKNRLIDKYGLNVSHKIQYCHGNTTNISKCLDKDTDQELAIRQQINGGKGLMKGEKIYFQKFKQYRWRNCRWALKIYDIFEDNHTQYSVVELLKGKIYTLDNWRKAFNDENYYLHIRQIVNVVKDYLDLELDLTKAGVDYKDHNPDNATIEVMPNGDQRYVVADLGSFAESSNRMLSYYPFDVFNQAVSLLGIPLYKVQDRQPNITEYDPDASDYEDNEDNENNENKMDKVKQDCINRITEGFKEAYKEYTNLPDPYKYPNSWEETRQIQNEYARKTVGPQFEKAKQILDQMVKDVEKIIKDNKSKKQ